MTPLPVPTSSMRGFCGQVRSQRYSTSCSVSGRGMSARLSETKVWSVNSTVPEKMLQRLTLAAAPNEFAKRRQFGLGQRALEIEIKLDPFLP